MSENLKQLQKFIDELNTTRTKYSDYTKTAVPTWFRKFEQDKRRPPRDFKDSSFMFIRSYDGDVGDRPFPSGLAVPFWYSPDIRISPISSIGSYTANLQGGMSYNINCALHNKGDLIVPAPKVEFFLCTPSLGMDTRYAQKLGVAQSTQFLHPLSSGEVNFSFIVSPSEAGHKCLFARAFSFSPLDIPNDPFSLSPPNDRHVAQFNLDFVPQAGIMPFQLIHLPNTNDNITIQPMNKEALMATRHPFLADFKIADNPEVNKALTKAKFDLSRQGTEGLKIAMTDNGLRLTANDNNKTIGLPEQKALHAAYRRALSAVSKGAPKNEFKAVFTAYKAMNEKAVATTFQLLVPPVNLQKGEIAGFNLVATHSVFGIKGGITVIVMG